MALQLHFILFKSRKLLDDLQYAPLDTLINPAEQSFGIHAPSPVVYRKLFYPCKTLDVSILALRTSLSLLFSKNYNVSGVVISRVQTEDGFDLDDSVLIEDLHAIFSAKIVRLRCLALDLSAVSSVTLQHAPILQTPPLSDLGFDRSNRDETPQLPADFVSATTPRPTSSTVLASVVVDSTPALKPNGAVAAMPRELPTPSSLMAPLGQPETNAEVDMTEDSEYESSESSGTDSFDMVGDGEESDTEKRQTERIDLLRSYPHGMISPLSQDLKPIQGALARDGNVIVVEDESSESKSETSSSSEESESSEEDSSSDTETELDVDKLLTKQIETALAPEPVLKAAKLAVVESSKPKEVAAAELSKSSPKEIAILGPPKPKEHAIVEPAKVSSDNESSSLESEELSDSDSRTERSSEESDDEDEVDQAPLNMRSDLNIMPIDTINIVRTPVWNSTEHVAETKVPEKEDSSDTSDDSDSTIDTRRRKSGLSAILADASSSFVKKEKPAEKIADPPVVVFSEKERNSPPFPNLALKPAAAHVEAEPVKKRSAKRRNRRNPLKKVKLPSEISEDHNLELEIDQDPANISKVVDNEDFW